MVSFFMDSMKHNNVMLFNAQYNVVLRHEHLVFLFPVPLLNLALPYYNKKQQRKKVSFFWMQHNVSVFFPVHTVFLF